MKDIEEVKKMIENMKKGCNNQEHCKIKTRMKFIAKSVSTNNDNPFYKIMHNRYNWNKVTEA
jgi:hypothetical protein